LARSWLDDRFCALEDRPNFGASRQGQFGAPSRLDFSLFCALEDRPNFGASRQRHFWTRNRFCTFEDRLNFGANRQRHFRACGWLGRERLYRRLNFGADRERPFHAYRGLDFAADVRHRIRQPIGGERVEDILSHDIIVESLRSTGIEQFCARKGRPNFRANRRRQFRACGGLGLHQSCGLEDWLDFDINQQRHFRTYSWLDFDQFCAFEGGLNFGASLLTRFRALNLADVPCGICRLIDDDLVGVSLLVDPIVEKL
jgi:hypothetical protein